MSDEAAFIAALRKLPLHDGARGLDDDAAILDIGGETLVVTHDILVGGVHTLPRQDPADIAWKLVASNMSDLAAKGAEPIGVLLGHMLGEDDARFLEGLHETLDHFGAPLLGGDTTSGGPPRTWGLTAIGRATHTPVPSRSGAQAGDQLYITGPVGAAMIGFEALRDGTNGDSSAYRRPMALLPQGWALAPHVTAMMDVSDGVLLDAFRMAQASKTAISIDSTAVPLAAPEDRRDDALRWGEDFELLFTAPDDSDLPIEAHPIGSVCEQNSAPLILDGLPISDPAGLGYQHGDSANG